MKFLREVSVNNITPDILSMETQENFLLVWKDDSVEIWYQDKVLNPDRQTDQMAA